MTQVPYTEEFYAGFVEASLRSARVVAPMVQELVGAKSVVDIGCGVGCWLKAFSECNATEIQGVDGPWVNVEKLLIPRERFAQHDMQQPVTLGRRFDLCVNVEVAEHLPESHARRFVENLTQLAPVILFSAAIPGQGGTGHVNEQWPDYWAALFSQFDFRPLDCLRRQIWQREEVEWWYRQNIVLFVHKEKLAEQPKLAALLGAALDLVHPKQLEFALQQQRGQLKPRSKDATFGSAWRQFRWAWRNAFARLFGKEPK